MARMALEQQRHAPGTAALHAAVRRTLAYADIFEYPLSAEELHRYLHGERAELAEVRAALDAEIPGVAGHGKLFTPAGRLASVEARRRRQAISTPMLRRARRYTFVLKHLPYVRMIGLTGSLSMGNVAERRDIDLMVVTAPGRVWLGRAAVVAIVRLARLAGDTLCPNYVVAENRLALDDPSIYGAHELAQLVPLYGGAAYRRLWAENPQVLAHLPNAGPHPLPTDRLLPALGLLKRLAEHALAGRLGDRLERWERRRKTTRLQQRLPGPTAEIVLSADQCKGHFSRHRARVLAAYRERLAMLPGDTSSWPVL